MIEKPSFPCVENGSVEDPLAYVDYYEIDNYDKDAAWYDKAKERDEQLAHEHYLANEYR